MLNLCELDSFDLFPPLLNSSRHFSPLLNSCRRCSPLPLYVYLYCYLYFYLTLHYSILLYSTQLESCSTRLDSSLVYSLLYSTSALLYSTSALLYSTSALLYRTLLYLYSFLFYSMQPLLYPSLRYFRNMPTGLNDIWGNANVHFPQLGVSL